VTAASTDRYPVAAMTAIVLASLVVLMDTTFIVLALPVIAEDLGAGSGAEWAVTAFLMATGIAQLVAGWSADRFGQKRVFVAAAAGFGVFAIVVAASPNLPWLVAARSLQGLCAGLIVPLATSITLAMFPEGRRATAVGISGTVVMLGPLLAPLLSGWVLGFASWRVLILFDVPIVAVVVAVGLSALPDDHEVATRVGRRPFDAAGLALLAVGLVAILLGLSEADRWPVPVTVAVCVGGLGLLLAYPGHARRVADPLVDLSVFRVPTFGLVLGIIAAVAVAQFARTVFIPLELQSVRGLSPLETGFALLPGGPGGRAGDAARRPVDRPHRWPGTDHRGTGPGRGVVGGIRAPAGGDSPRGGDRADGGEQRRDRPLHDAGDRDRPVRRLRAAGAAGRSVALADPPGERRLRDRGARDDHHRRARGPDPHRRQ
jgi:EmrB/QacA subfamily drug resistance transporter